MRAVSMLAAACAAAIALAQPGTARAAMADEVRALNAGIAHITYEVKGSAQQAQMLDQLEQSAAALVARYPGKAEPLLCQGIIVSEQANFASIFRKLGLARQARDLLTRSYAIDPKAADGGAALSLAVLYYKVPGSPIGFGDDDKARKLLDQALAMDPDGLDANFFYGDFLIEQGDKAGAKEHLLRALRAPRDPARPVWDAGRRRDIAALLRKTQ